MFGVVFTEPPCSACSASAGNVAFGLKSALRTRKIERALQRHVPGQARGIGIPADFFRNNTIFIVILIQNDFLEN